MVPQVFRTRLPTNTEAIRQSLGRCLFLAVFAEPCYIVSNIDMKMIWP